MSRPQVWFPVDFRPAGDDLEGGRRGVDGIDRGQHRRPDPAPPAIGLGDVDQASADVVDCRASMAS
jgi:hypothetical protein